MHGPSVESGWIFPGWLLVMAVERDAGVFRALRQDIKDEEDREEKQRREVHIRKIVDR